jgi:YggT family protein
MSGTSLNAILFLISAVFDLYIFVLIIRLILAWSGAEYSHPITQLVVQLTSFIIKPMKKILPDIRGFETSTLVLILVVEIIKYFVITALSFGVPNILGLLLLAIGDSIKLVLELMFYAIFLQFIVGLIQPSSPIYQVLSKLTSPALRPFQRIIPTVGGFDLSPIPALIILQLLIIIVVNPILGMGLSIAVG